MYNGADLIVSTIESIAMLKDKATEFIVVDGGSKDQTLEIVKRYGPVVDTVISEPDDGIFDAMNKGIELAKGSWVMFINAGDKLLLNPSAIDWEEHRDASVVYGNTMRANGEIEKPYSLDLIETGSLPMCHQSTIYNKSLLKDELRYDLSYRLYGENALLMKLYQKGSRIEYVDEVFSFFLGGGVSDEVSWETRKAKYTFLYQYYGVKGVAKGLFFKLGWIKYAREE